MKKFIYFVMLLVLFSCGGKGTKDNASNVASSVTINSTIFGLHLGEQYSDEVIIGSLIEHYPNYPANRIEGVVSSDKASKSFDLLSVVYPFLDYADYPWRCISVNVDSDSYLYEVSFSVEPPDVKTAETMFGELEDKLTSKYGKRNKMDSEGEKWYRWTDGNNSVDLAMSDSKDYLLLRFVNNKLLDNVEKKQQAFVDNQL